MQVLPIYLRRQVISANTIGFGRGEALQKLPMLSLFVRILIKLLQAETEIKFKFQIILDRHNPRLKLNYCLLPDPHNFLLLSTCTFQVSLQ
jgi:hypothetical protein